MTSSPETQKYRSVSKKEVWPTANTKGTNSHQTDHKSSHIYIYTEYECLFLGWCFSARIKSQPMFVAHHYGAPASLSAGTKWGRHSSERLFSNDWHYRATQCSDWLLSHRILSLEQRAGWKTVSDASAAVYFLWMLENTQSPVPALASQGSHAQPCYLETCKRHTRCCSLIGCCKGGGFTLKRDVKGWCVPVSF